MLIKCDRICRNMWYICEYMQIFDIWHIRPNFRICNFENAIICGNICDMRMLAKYAVAYLIITSIPIQ